jgi:hypothetical protein
VPTEDRKNKETPNLNVCDQLWNKILNAEFNRDKYFVDEVETIIKIKTTLGQPNPGNPLFRRQS